MDLYSGGMLDNALTKEDFHSFHQSHQMNDWVIPRNKPQLLSTQSFQGH